MSLFRTDCFHVICELLVADDLESLLGSLYSSLREKFGVERVTLKVSAISDSPGIAEIDPAHATSEAYVEALAMVRHHSHCDERLPSRLLEYLFGGIAEIKSVALIPLLTSPQAPPSACWHWFRLETAVPTRAGDRSSGPTGYGIGGLHTEAPRPGGELVWCTNTH